MRLALADGDLCPDAPLAEGQTNDNGVVRLAASTCGEAQVVVSSPGLITQRPVVDTCDGKTVHVQLAKAPPAREPGDACGRDALQFLSAWVVGDNAVASSRYADASYYRPYKRFYPTPEVWAIRIDSSRASGGRCRVIATFFEPNGCEPAYAIELERSDRGWLIRDRPQRGSGHEPPP